MPKQTSIADRLENIEREVRAWRIIGILSAGCLTLFFALGADANPEVPRLIKAQQFQLVDDDGTVRATLKTLGESNTQLRLFDGTGKSELAMIANDSRAIVHLTNDNRINSASIEAYASGGSMGLSRQTGDGKAWTHVVGGTAGSFVKFQPLKGNEVVLPAE